MKKLSENPNFQVAVIGGGIYGCHFAHVFKTACERVSSIKGENISAKLIIYEKDDVLFSQASGKNSFRIHKGFHYPRSGSTRNMCFHDHNRFKLMYPNFFQTLADGETPAFSKVFAVAKSEETKLDYEAMRNILVGASSYEEDQKSMWDLIDGELWSDDIRNSADAEHKRNQMRNLGFNVDLIDGAFLVQVEPILYADEPRKWFSKKFSDCPYVQLQMNTRVDRRDIMNEEGTDSNLLLVHNNPVNLVLNCTYNQAIPMQLDNHNAFYDLCISVIVAERMHDDDRERAPHESSLSFGIFDGPFPSLEPYDFSNSENLPDELKTFEGRNLFQIFDVELSSVACSSNPIVAYDLMKIWEQKKQNGSMEYEKVVQDIWNKCELYFPRLGIDFELAGTWFALKTKVVDANASRPLIVVPDTSVDEKNRFLQIFSSKLTSIFKAEELVLEIMDGTDEH